jgi:hypothetical protein
MCGPDAITIKITVIEHDRIFGEETFSTGIVEFSSQKE